MTDIVVLEKLSLPEQALAENLQGVLNRQGKHIFLDVDRYKDFVDSGESRRFVSLEQLLTENASSFSGCVLYDLDCVDVGVNLAATISAAYDILGLPRALQHLAEQCGIKVLADLANVSGTSAQRQRIVLDYCLPRLNKDGLIHQVVKKGNCHLRLRDFGIYKRWPTVYTDESDEGRQLRCFVLDNLNSNIPVYGWNDDEIAFIRDVSEHGDYVVPSDWSANHSYFSTSDVPVKQNTKRSAPLPNKHYVAFVVSDGDNVQWLERDFATTHIFGQRQRSAMDYKLSWTFSPSLAPLCRPVAESIFNSVKQDYFISGVSGVGYINCLSYPQDKLDAFTELTAKTMQHSDLSVVCLLDNINLMKSEKFVEQRLYSYARFPNIKGGIWELDPDRYGSGHGKVFWSNGKPFVSVRFTLWHPSCDPNQVTTEWLDEMVEQLNAMPVCPDSTQGYSVVNVHPWTINIQQLDYVVSRLQSHIQLVYADELVEMVQSLTKRN